MGTVDKNMHDGHRLRVKQRFLHEGLQHFAPHEIIEMLLFFGVPVRDVNGLAHVLLERFGSLSGVLEAPFEELKRVKGVSDHVATLICFCCQLSRAYYEDKMSLGTVLNSIHEVGKFILPKFMGMKNEAVVLLSMDNRRKVLNCTTVFEGSVNATEINVRLVLQQALRDNATVAVLAHNHPNGHAFPSADDVQTTVTLYKALAVAGVRLVDHLIVSEDDFVSMAQTPSLHDIFEQPFEL